MKKLFFVCFIILTILSFTACEQPVDLIQGNYTIDEVQSSLNESIDIYNEESKNTELIEKSSFELTAHSENLYYTYIHKKSSVLVQYVKKEKDNSISSIVYVAPYNSGRTSISYEPYKIAIMRLLQPSLSFKDASALAKDLIPVDDKGIPLKEHKTLHIGEGSTQIDYSTYIEGDELYFSAQIIRLGVE